MYKGAGRKNSKLFKTGQIETALKQLGWGIVEGTEEKKSEEPKKEKSLRDTLKDQFAKLTKKKETQDSSLTIQDVWKWVKKNRTWFLILIPLILSIYLRTIPLYLPIADAWAEDSVHQSIRDQLQAESYKQFPNLDDKRRSEYVQRELEKFILENKEQVNTGIQATSQYFKSQMQNDEGHTYLLDIDSYVWYGLAKNYVKYGAPGDITDENGVSYNSLRDGRFNPIVGFNSISYLTAIIYKVWHFFSDKASLMVSAVLLQIIFMALAVIPGYLLGKELGGELAGFITGMYVAFHNSILVRTISTDNDIFNIFFPLMIAFCIVKTLKSEKKAKWIWLGTAIFFMGLYPFFWKGYWFVYLFMALLLFSYGAYLLVDAWRRKSDVKKAMEPFLMTVIFYIGTALIKAFFNLISGTNTQFFKMFSEVIKAPLISIWFVEIKEVATVDIWPNVLTTVAELNSASIGTIIGTFDGFVFLAAGLTACVLAIHQKKLDKKDWLLVIGSFFYFYFILARWEKGKIGNVLFLIGLCVPLGIAMLKSWYEKKEYPVYSGLLIVVWFAGTLYASTTSLRFLALVGPIYALGWAVCIAKIGEFVGIWSEEQFHIKRVYVMSIIAAFALLMMVTPIQDAKALATQQIPHYNDAWDNSLKAIREDTSDSIITSWWDFGHWFAAIGERRVTFDGGNQGNRIHWVGKVLLEDDEETSVGILKMLNCGQEYSYEALKKYNPRGKIDSITLLYTLSNKEREEAKQLLLDRELTEQQAEEVLNFTHCEFLPNYLIASEDMVQKSGVWGHFGSWNFTIAEMYNKVKGKDRTTGIHVLEEGYTLSKEEAEEKYQKIQEQTGDQFVTNWPGFASSRVGCQIQGTMIQCAYGNNYVGVINATNNEAWIVVGGKGAARPYSLVYADDKDVKELKYADATNDFSIILIPTQSGFESLLASQEHGKSLFTRLFYFEGHGLRHFELLYDTKSFTNQRIQVWKVHWEPQEPRKIFQAKTNETQP